MMMTMIRLLVVVVEPVMLVTVVAATPAKYWK